MTRRIVSAASGPYEAEARASSPSTGMPCKAPICSSGSASERSGLPKRIVRRFIARQQQELCPFVKAPVLDPACSGDRRDRCTASALMAAPSPRVPSVPHPAARFEHKHGHATGIGRAIGLGLITGAADDDPSAIGTYATAGARLGPSFLWTAPVTFPMMVAVVYLSSKLGQVTGKGLFDVIRDHYPRWILHVSLVGVLIGNTIEAAADLGGMAAALNLLVPIPERLIVLGVGLAILSLQIWGSYTLIRNIFRWLFFFFFFFF